MLTRDEQAVSLAEKHYQVEAGLTHVFRMTTTAEQEDLPTEPIKLLEVNQNTVPAGIMPLQFGPSVASGLPYPSIIVEVTPDEFHLIQEEQLPLPHGWTLGDLIPRRNAEPHP